MTRPSKHSEFSETEAVSGITDGAPALPTAAPPSGIHDRPDPPEFTLEGCIEAAERFAASDQPHEAIAEYKRALLLLGSERGEIRAHLYVELGELTRATGNTRIAANNFVKALAILPLDERAHRGALEIALETADWRSADELLRARAAALTDGAARRSAWRDCALVWLERAKNPARALPAIEAWLGLSPEDAEALGHLVAVRDAQGDHSGAIDARRRLAACKNGGPAADLLAKAALIARDALADTTLAVELVAAALEADPARKELLNLAEELHHARESWTELAALYDRVIDKAASLDVILRLGALARERLSDLDRAAGAYRRAAELDPADPTRHRVLAEIELERGDLAAARACTDSVVALSPRDARSHRLSYTIAARAGDGDRAFNAAMVLEWLGEAEITESVLADAHRPEGLLGVQQNLTDADWIATSPFDGCADLAHALELLTGPAIEARLELERRRKTAPLDESTRQDLTTSTATLMRALLWTARVLGIEPPAVYVEPDLVPATLPAITSTAGLRVSRELGSGLGLNELAFLWGRALTAFRPGHRLAACYPDEQSLSALLVAARAIAGCKGAATPEGDAKIIAGVLDKSLDRATRESLKKPLKTARDAEAAARRWLSAHELGCCRAGLLACGDIAVAAALSPRFEFGAVTSAAEQVDHLLVFTASEAYGELRRRLGLGVAH